MKEFERKKERKLYRRAHGRVGRAGFYLKFIRKIERNRQFFGPK